MKCPWLIEKTTRTDNVNSFNNSQRKEIETFANCVKKDCPFYYHDGVKDRCRRAQGDIMS